MATYTVTAPNGKIYEVSGPDGATEDEVRTQVLAQHPDAGESQKAPTAPRTEDSEVEEVVVTGKRNLPKTSAPGAAARGFGRSVLPLLAGVGTGAVTGGIGGAMFGGWGAIPGSIIGGIAGGMEAYNLQDKYLKAHPKFAATVGQSPELRAADERQHPLATAIGENAAGFLTGRPGRGVMNNLVSSGLSGGMEAARQGWSGEETNAGKIAIAAGMGAAQNKGWALSNLGGSLGGNVAPKVLSPLEQLAIRNNQSTPMELAEKVAAVRSTGARPVAYDVLAPKAQATVVEATRHSPVASERSSNYTAKVLAESPTVGKAALARVAPSDVRTADEAARIAASDIAEHPDVIAAKPDVVSGEAGSKIHEAFNADLDARESNMSATYKKAEEGGKTVINPSVATPADLSSRLKAAFDPHAEIFGEIDLPASARRFTKMSSFLTDTNELDVGQIFKMRKQLNSVIGGKPGSPDAAAAKDMKKVLDGFMDEVVDAPDGLVGDPNTVNDWRSAIGQRREIGQLYQANDVMQDITEREFSGGKKVPKMGADFVSKRLLGNLTGTKDQVKDLTALRDRLGENDPKWVALQREGLAKVLGKDLGTKNFGAALKKFESDNPALAKLLITDEDRIRLAKGQNVVQGAIGRTEAQKVGSGIMDANPTDFAGSIGTMDSAALRDARVAGRQVLRDAMNTPDKSAAMLSNIASGADSQANIIKLFGPDEGAKLIADAKAATTRLERYGALRPHPVEGEVDPVAKFVPLAGATVAGAKIAPMFQTLNFLMTYGFSKRKAEQLVSDALDPTKVDSAVAAVSKYAGANAAEKFLLKAQDEATRNQGRAAKYGRAATKMSVRGGTDRNADEVAPEPETPVEPAAEEPAAEDAQASTSPDYEVPYMAQIIAGHEGTGDNPTSTAIGRFQFLRDTLASMYNKEHPDPADHITGVQAEAMRADGRISAEDINRYGVQFTADNVQRVLDAGAPVTVGNVYIMHFAGEGAGPKMLKALEADPTTPVTAVLSPEAIHDNKNIHTEDGKYLKDFTVQDFSDWAEYSMRKSYDELKDKNLIE